MDDYIIKLNVPKKKNYKIKWTDITIFTSNLKFIIKISVD